MRLQIALSALICFSSCGDSALERLQAAEARRVEAEARTPSALPAECRRELDAAPRLGERLDQLAVRQAGVIGALHAQIRGCAAWWDAVSGGR